MNSVLIVNAPGDSDFNGPDYVAVPLTPENVLHWTALASTVRDLQQKVDAGIRHLALHTELPVWLRWDERYEELLAPVERRGHALFPEDEVAALMADTGLVIGKPFSTVHVWHDSLYFNLSSPVEAMSDDVGLAELRDAVEQQLAGPLAG